ncbi:MAG TPA: NAD-dependent epimerase/dehydratase family protein [Longimicrobiales bacterium]|nr:NAD-dependent epimerase/dehydratase family protein [Longimicrobiales bacterium]
MPQDRRQFLATSASAALGLSAVTGMIPLPAAGTPVSRARKPLRILILGGTSFIGPHQVEYALGRGHEITLFNRGRTNPGMFSELETLIGDRTGDVKALEGRQWDVVLDNSAQEPEWVELTGRVLRDNVRRYILVSTRSVYSDLSSVPSTAAAPVYTLENTQVEPGQRRPYGLRKALCEQAARAAFGERATIVRPGLIIGPGDETDRFTYWPVRIERGGEVLAPGDGTDPVQIIDARDLSEWMIRLSENDTPGTFNAVGPFNPRPFDELLHGIRAVTTAETSFTWVDTDWLLERDVRPYSDLPVWMPARGRNLGFARFDLTPEVQAGLTFRSLARTTADTLAWWHEQPKERQVLKTGLKPERETELLSAYRKMQAGRR